MGRKIWVKNIVFAAALVVSSSGSSQVVIELASGNTNINSPANAGEFNTLTATYEDYIGALSRRGWQADVYYDPNGSVTLEIEKRYKGEEGHGLLGINWENREIWELQYIQENSGIFKLYAANGTKEEKAPLFGEWNEIKSSKKLPREIYQKALIFSAN